MYGSGWPQKVPQLQRNGDQICMICLCCSCLIQRIWCFFASSMCYNCGRLLVRKSALHWADAGEYTPDDCPASFAYHAQNVENEYDALNYPTSCRPRVVLNDKQKISSCRMCVEGKTKAEDWTSVGGSIPDEVLALQSQRERAMLSTVAFKSRVRWPTGIRHSFPHISVCGFVLLFSHGASLIVALQGVGSVSIRTPSDVAGLIGLIAINGVQSVIAYIRL